MKKMVAIASLLVGITWPVAPIHAAPQDASQQIKQSFTKKTRAVAAHAAVLYTGPPRFVAIEETSISYATNTPQKVISFGNNFYSNIQEVWLMSSSPQGPWRQAPFIPNVVAAIVCSQLNSDPLEPYQLCALPWASGLSYAVWKPS
jgi:hypothetical protein